MVCLSFHTLKVITTAECGIVAVRDKRVGELLRQLRQHAMSVSDFARHITKRVVFEGYPERGFNYRMTDMQAALGLCQLEALDDILAARRRLAERYTAALAGAPHLEPPYEPDYAHRTWQSYCVRVLPGAPVGRTE